MEEYQARESGYSFTGIYERTREDAKSKADKVRKQGYRTVLVPERATGYERRAGTRKGMILGYSVYAERKYFTDRTKKDIRGRLEGIPGRKSRSLEEYDQKIREIDEEKEKLTARLKELESEPNPTKAQTAEISRIKRKLTRNPGAAWHTVSAKKLLKAGYPRQADEHFYSATVSKRLGIPNPRRKSRKNPNEKGMVKSLLPVLAIATVVVVAISYIGRQASE